MNNVATHYYLSQTNESIPQPTESRSTHTSYQIAKSKTNGLINSNRAYINTLFFILTIIREKDLLNLTSSSSLRFRITQDDNQLIFS